MPLARRTWPSPLAIEDSHRFDSCAVCLQAHRQRQTNERNHRSATRQDSFQHPVLAVWIHNDQSIRIGQLPPPWGLSTAFSPDCPGLAERLVGIEIVVQVDWVERGMAGGMGAEPAACVAALTILLRRAVPRSGELRFGRDGLIVPGRHQGGAQHSMEIFRPALASQPLRALFAADLVGAEIRGSVQRDQRVPAGRRKASGPPERCDTATRTAKAGCANAALAGSSWRGCGCRRDPGHLEQRLPVRSGVAVAALALKVEKGRGLRNENRERGHADNRHRIDDVLPPARRWETPETPAKAVQQDWQDLHRVVESYPVDVSQLPPLARVTANPSRSRRSVLANAIRPH